MPQQEVQLVITMGPGGVTVGGPIENMLLCFGLLEIAKQSIIDHNEQAKKLVQPVSLVPPDDIFGKRG